MTDIVFDFADIASRVNRAKKPEPVAVKPAPSQNAASTYQAQYQAALQHQGTLYRSKACR